MECEARGPDQLSLLRSLRSKVAQETLRSAQLRSSAEANGFALRVLGDEMRRLQRFEDGDEALRLRRLDGLAATTKVGQRQSVLLRHVATEARPEEPLAEVVPEVSTAAVEVQTEWPSEPLQPVEPVEPVEVEELEILEDGCVG